MYPNSSKKEIIFTEILARVLKNHLGGLLRKEMEKICIPSHDPYIRVMVSFLNKLMQHEKHPRMCNLIKCELLDQFPSALDEHEMPNSWSVWKGILSYTDLFTRLFSLISISISKNAKDEINAGRRVLLMTNDIVEMKMRVKRLSLIDAAIARAYMYQAQHGSYGQQKIRLYKLADQKFQQAAKSSTHDDNTLYTWASCLIKQAMCSKKKDRQKLLAEAEKKLRFLCDISENLPHAWFKFAMVSIRVGVFLEESEAVNYFSSARSQYEEAFKLDPLMIDKLIKKAKKTWLTCHQKYTKQPWLYWIKKKMQNFSLSLPTDNDTTEWDGEVALLELKEAVQLHENALYFSNAPNAELYLQLGQLFMIWYRVCPTSTQMDENLLCLAGQCIGAAIRTHPVVSDERFVYVIKYKELMAEGSIPVIRKGNRSRCLRYRNKRIVGQKYSLGRCEQTGSTVLYHL
eukprot:TRINITY_DN7916_c0_g1_i2.p1 TRINITY_DN7916_c0_g1~~TRINITY_DN7916_c0_g1_i2.p1  ORF type:complete len:479 (-),score=78.04 TRINITY_DN7916_c0_g1_i2:226-1599(-)